MTDTYKRINPRRRQTSRKIVFMSDSGNHPVIYDTAYTGPWTLTGYGLSAPERVTNYVTVPGRDGELDLAYALTGEPVYKNRRLEISLENSDGNKTDRDALISDLLNKLDGRYVRVVLPDDEMHYLTGSVETDIRYSDVNHCALTLTVTAAPWREARYSKFYDLSASASEQTVIIKNEGGRRVIPALTAYADGSTPNITVTCGTWSAQPTADAILPEALAMRYLDEKVLTYSGAGHLVIQWQEANL